MDLDVLAGDALDQAVASRFFGRQGNSCIRFRYSADPASAWDVVKAIMAEQPAVEFTMSYADGFLETVFYDPRTTVQGLSRSRKGSTHEVASCICRAALRFVANWESHERSPWPSVR